MLEFNFLTNSTKWTRIESVQKILEKKADHGKSSRLGMCLMTCAQQFQKTDQEDSKGKSFLNEKTKNTYMEGKLTQIETSFFILNKTKDTDRGDGINKESDRSVWR